MKLCSLPGLAILAATFSPTVFGTAMVDLFVSHVGGYPGGVYYPGGYFPPWDSTMVRDASGISNPWYRTSQEYALYWFDRGYQSDVSVNSSRSIGCLTCFEVIYPNTSAGYASGYADASQLALGVYGSISADRSGAESDAKARISNTLTIGALPASGLVLGDPVTLLWNYHLRGSTSLSADADTWILSTFSGGASFTRQNATCGGSEASCSQVLAGFGFSTDASLAHWGGVSDAYNDVNWGFSTVDGRWAGSEYETGVDAHYGLWNTDTLLANPESGLGPPVPMGSIVYMASVGDVIRFDASLSSFLIMGGGGSLHSFDSGQARNDFFGTLDGSVTVLTPGAQVDWSVPLREGEVPEPSSLLLAGGALAILQLLRRRYHARAAATGV